ncbi:MAG: SET domain-containing protein-lysine N-methyltransferase [Gemmatimonadaceae bacterium]|nr:SET domain-containing protein-lysine N-methyltransferase [Gemmatimonadaceae bacterium]
MSINSQRATPASSEHDLPGTVLHTDSPLVGVLVDQHERRLIAIRPIAKGSLLYRLEGHETPVPTKYSVQIAIDMHLDQSDARDATDRVRRRPWRYMNHSCDPNTRIADREVRAVRDIAVGDAVTFHYNTTEYEMAEPFECRCRTPVCDGVIRGAKFLTADQRARLGPWLADYLR